MPEASITSMASSTRASFGQPLITPASIQSVDPDHLRRTMALFENWSTYTGNVNDEGRERKIEGPDLHTTLDSLVRKFSIDGAKRLHCPSGCWR